MTANPSVDPSAPAPARFSDGQRVLTLEEIKGTLLSVADKMVTTMSDVIVDNVKNDKKGKNLFVFLFKFAI